MRLSQEVKSEVGRAWPIIFRHPIPGPQTELRSANRRIGSLQTSTHNWSQYSKPSNMTKLVLARYGGPPVRRYRGTLPVCLGTASRCLDSFLGGFGFQWLQDLLGTLHWRPLVPSRRAFLGVRERREPVTSRCRRIRACLERQGHHNGLVAGVALQRRLALTRNIL